MSARNLTLRPRMRRAVPLTLAALGAFLATAGVIALTWVPGQVERTPLDTDKATLLSGSASVLGADGELHEGPVLAFSHHAVDAARSDHDVAVWSTSLCLVRDEDGIDGCVDADDPDARLINVDERLFVTDRVTAEAVSDDGYLPAGTPQPSGLQNKWPFHAEKRTYPVWDDIVGAAVEATYQGVQEVDGLEVYEYSYASSVGPVVLVGDIEGTYDATYTFDVEPTTGVIVDQVVHQERIAHGIDPILVLDLRLTDDQVRANVEEARKSLATLQLLEVVVPAVGLGAGVPLLLVGLTLLALSPRTRR
ncbi:DUF3068 domain-containing protein [Nocardioides mangrovi]|uniref:DUF3068 domain-containing protein n=1 Tax=Nocardioides mangrovi TaxID=2874580 RepID=A0ABS7UDT5_9ACTN|nr:DUF3068 domain-containing protein [Nocardioides mangrovi]MBZ5739149.1 DUF3068 domain-containing protein [Nocardioides mangrovi]